MMPVKAGAARTHLPRVADATRTKTGRQITAVMRGLYNRWQRRPRRVEVLLVKTLGRSYERRTCKNFAVRREEMGPLIPEMHYVTISAVIVPTAAPVRR